ncbi:MAG: uracil-DNA glycosylase [Variovorax sp.]|nr:uracil-DNA glycosylase [Variovorax sp.]
MTEATMQLDARQRAMLEEMGVKVWWPTVERMAATAAPEVVEPVASRSRAAAPAESLPPATANAATPATAATPAARRAPGAAQAAAVLIEPAIRLYDGSGPPENGWLLVVDTPPSADGRHDDEPFAGEAGRLLQNMLRALQLDRGTAPVHLARVHRSATGAPPGDVAPLSTGFAAQAASLAPRLVLALGPLSTQGLMQSDEPLGKLRGRVAQVQVDQGVAETPLVASYHPIYLLRNPADKAKAWADLCLAAAEFERVAS